MSISTRFQPRHGEASALKSREYRTWMGMKRRCYNDRMPTYKNYGGRGIVVCERWRSRYENFLADMGRCPSGQSLDRINTDGNYAPDNCRWAPPSVQLNNKRTNRRIEFRGQTKTVAEWEHALGFNKSVVKGRLRIGWSVEKALTTPAR